MALTIFQGLVFVLYVGFLMIKFKGPLPSISDSWYRLQGLEKSFFTWFTWMIGFPLFFQTNGSTALFFVAGAGLCLVGVATMFKLKDDIQPYLHFAGALLGILGSLVGIGVERGGWPPLVLFCIATLGLLKVKNHTWWIEIAAFVAILFGLFVYNS